MAKVRRGLTSVLCSELRGVRFSIGGSKYISSMVKSIGASKLSTVQRLSAFLRVHYYHYYIETDHEGKEWYSRPQ